MPGFPSQVRPGRKKKTPAPLGAEVWRRRRTPSRVNRIPWFKVYTVAAENTRNLPKRSEKKLGPYRTLTHFGRFQDKTIRSCYGAVNHFLAGSEFARQRAGKQETRAQPKNVFRHSTRTRVRMAVEVRPNNGENQHNDS